ncbi:2OG-Fe dioxygenase family protein [Micromonospora sp. NPDC049102]|uniref:2OG-Fe dioxygenase family protein n=1 Tax=Micromonospora sp. NPDC049102 TaxID=3364265 RepID=UPI00371ECC65
MRCVAGCARRATPSSRPPRSGCRRRGRQPWRTCWPRGRRYRWIPICGAVPTGAGGTASPSPEGVHRDGFDFIALHHIGRQGVTGGTTSPYDHDGSLVGQLHADIGRPGFPRVGWWWLVDSAICLSGPSCAGPSTARGRCSVASGPSVHAPRRSRR